MVKIDVVLSEELERVFKWAAYSESEVMTLREFVLLMMDDDYNPFYDLMIEYNINRRIFRDKIVELPIPEAKQTKIIQIQDFTLKTDIGFYHIFSGLDGKPFNSMDFIQKLISKKSPISKAFKEQGITADLMNEVQQQVRKSLENMTETEVPVQTEQDEISDQDYVLQFGDFIQITSVSHDHCFGRDTEIDEIKRILSKKLKNKVFLVGEFNIGKDCMVNKIARDFLYETDAKYPLLKDAMIFKLNTISLCDGISNRMEILQRVRNIIRILGKKHTHILYVEYLENLFDISLNGDTVTIDEVLISEFSKNRLKCIFSTTPAVHKAFFKQQPQFLKFTDMLLIDELSVEDTVMACMAVQTELQTYYATSLTGEQIEKLCTLQKDNKSGHFPEKAINFMDNLMSECSKKYAVGVAGFKPVLTDKVGIMESIETMLHKKYIITDKDIFDFHDKISKKNKIVPKTHAAYEEAKKNIKQKIKGQDEHIDSIVELFETKSLLHDLPGLPDYNMPLNIMTIGGTGVGKTSLFELVCKELLGEELFVVSSETMSEIHTISDLKGSPDGYIGSEKTAGFIKYMMDYPNGMILFNEIEKANSMIWNFLLSMLEGQFNYLKESTVINTRGLTFGFTSNVGSQNASVKMLGFQTKDVSGEKYMDSLRKVFPPEFIGRMDLVCVFNNINRNGAIELMKMEIEKLKEALNFKNKDVFTMNLDEYCEQNIDTTEFDKKGVRGIKSFLKTEVVKELKKAVQF